ncbi:MAG: zf-HC2 domain-containing protein [Clostridia bacterium]|nr:zf-HC2 domain-containing protein [Clostridia bacterium]
MNKNDECEVVKDLSSLHIENMLSESSKKFIEGHLKGCNKCQEYYKALNSTFLNDYKKEKNNDEIEINHLKKVNKKMTILKWILFGIIVTILILMFYFFLKNVYIDSINSLNIVKIKNMQQNSNNYKLVHTTTQINKETNEKSIIEVVHYYKDGKHKEVSSHLVDGKMTEETIMFIDDYGYERASVFHSLKQIDKQTQDFIQEQKGDTLNLFISLVMLNDAGVHRLGLKTRTEMFNNRECYVVSDVYSGSFRENYIDKETGDLVRVVSGSENFYNEELFTLTENVVTDEDVDISILESDKYKDYKINNIDYKIDEKIRFFYE